MMGFIYCKQEVKFAERNNFDFFVKSLKIFNKVGLCYKFIVFVAYIEHLEPNYFFAIFPFLTDNFLARIVYFVPPKFSLQNTICLQIFSLCPTKNPHKSTYFLVFTPNTLNNNMHFEVNRIPTRLHTCYLRRVFSIVPKMFPIVFANVCVCVGWVM